MVRGRRVRHFSLLVYGLAVSLLVLLSVWASYHAVNNVSNKDAAIMAPPQPKRIEKEVKSPITAGKRYANSHAHYPLDDSACSINDAIRMPPAQPNFLDLTRNNLQPENAKVKKFVYTKVSHYNYQQVANKLVNLQACLYTTLHRWSEFAEIHNMTNWAAHGGTAMSAQCHGAMNPWDDDIDITLADCTLLNKLWEAGQDVSQAYPEIPKHEYLRQANHQVFEGRLVTPDLILLKGSKCCRWFKFKTIAQCKSGLRPEPQDISGLDIECIRPKHLATSLPGEAEARILSGWNDYNFAQGGLDDVMFGPTKIQLVPQPILSKYIHARYGKRDPCSFPFANGQQKALTTNIASGNEDGLGDEEERYMYLPIIRQYSMDFAMQHWYISKAKRDSWRRQAGSGKQEQLTKEIPNLDRVEIDNTISQGECSIASNKTLKVFGFNAERGTHWTKFAQLIMDDQEQPDVIILNEMDIGMARSGNMHTTRRLAYALKMNYAFGVEFIELTRGTKEEQDATVGQRDALGIHGNAILTKCHIETDDAMVVRDIVSSDYFSNKATAVNAKGYEIRLGGRMGMFVRIHDDNKEQQYVIGSVHKLAEITANQVTVKQYFSMGDFSHAPKNGLLAGIVVQGDFARTLCKWAGLENADNPRHHTWPASCEPELKFGTHRGDNICTNMLVVDEDRVTAPCYKSENDTKITLSDHAIVSVMLQSKL